MVIIKLKGVFYMTVKYDYVIVGSGLFGAVFARLLMDEGKSCLVIEKRQHTGGNIYTEDMDGIIVHKYGAHIFHTSDTEVWEFVNRYARFSRFTNSPVANYNGRLYNLPFNMNTFYQMWGVRTPAEAQKKIRQQRAAIKGEPKNLEQQAISLVGKDIYEKLIKGYTQKQWGRPCSELPAFIIRRIPVRFTYDNNYFDDLYQGIPYGGYTGLIDKLLSGADVICGKDFLKDREKYMQLGRRVLYTGMIDAYFDYKYGFLDYRSLRFETRVLKSSNYQGVAVMNYTDDSTKFTRVIEHRHFEERGQSGTVITREYPAQFKKGMEPYYPVNDDKNQKLFEKYKALAKKEKNVVFGGRLADYKYYNMDAAVRAAIDLYRRERDR